MRLSAHYETRNEYTFFAMNMIQDHNFKDVMSNISHLEEENRFFNWYKGYTDIDIPYWGTTQHYKGPCSEASCLIQQLSTKATSGTISMQYFGDEFDVNKIETNLFYTIQIHPPVKQSHNESITLHLEIEKNMLEGFDILSRGWITVASAVLRIAETVVGICLVDKFGR